MIDKLLWSWILKSSGGRNARQGLVINFRLICLAVSLLVEFRAPLPEQAWKTTGTVQMVFADFGAGAGTETVMDVQEGQLRLLKPIFLKGHGLPGGWT